MTFLELAKERYSVRKYKDQPVEQEKIDMILEASKVAPTACNKQPQKIYVVKSEEMKAKLASVCRFTFGAPVIMVVCYDKTREWQNNLMPGYTSGETDAAIACTHMMLEAWDLGLGSCWVAWFNADEVANVLGIPENEQVLALLPIGYAADDAKPASLHSTFREDAEMVQEL